MLESPDSGLDKVRSSHRVLGQRRPHNQISISERKITGEHHVRPRGVRRHYLEDYCRGLGVKTQGFGPSVTVGMKRTRQIGGHFIGLN